MRLYSQSNSKVEYESMVQAQLFSTSPFGDVKLKMAASIKILVAREKAHTRTGTLCVVSYDRTEIVKMTAKLEQ